MLQVPAYILPAPEGVFVALWSGIAVSPASALGYYHPLWSTLSNALLGFMIGASETRFRGTATFRGSPYEVAGVYGAGGAGVAVTPSTRALAKYSRIAR